MYDIWNQIVFQVLNVTQPLFYRWLKSLHQKQASMGMPSATLWQLTFLMGKNWKILCHPLTTVM